MQDALKSLTKENVRLRADMDYLQRQLDLAVQQADQAQPAVAHLPKTTLHVSSMLHWHLNMTTTTGKHYTQLAPAQDHTLCKHYGQLATA